jgi:hypothetical protein
MLSRFALLLGICTVMGLTAHAELKAGAAKRIVTPDPLLPVSGGMGVPNPAEIKNDDLTVRALVLEKDGEKVAILGADFIGFPSASGNKVREKVKGIKPENILIGVTHTHSAPEMYDFGIAEGKNTGDLKYIGLVVDKMAEAINEAATKLAPVNVKINTGEAAEKIAYNYYAPQLYDRRCSVIQFLGKTDGKAVCTLVNYAIHPEVIGNDQKMLGPDMVGPLYKKIEAEAGGMALFMNGAQGGMVTADCRGADGKDVQTWDECIRIGELLANEALRIIKDAPVQEDPVLICKAKTVNFPMDNETFRKVTGLSRLGYKFNDDGTVSTQMNVINLGNAQILTIPGEALPNIGYYLKRNMRGEHNMLFGLTNDAFGYILTKEDFQSFKRYDYVSRTSLGEMTGEILIDKGLEFVNSLPEPQKLAPAKPAEKAK